MKDIYYEVDNWWGESSIVEWNIYKQAEKLKSREMKEGWMNNDEYWMNNDEGWMVNDEGWWFQAVEGFWWQTDKQTNGHLWL